MVLAHLLTCSLTHLLTYSLTHLLTYSLTHLLTQGADETLAGYLYFHKAPDGTELHEECVRKVKDLYMYDCLRANKVKRH